MSKKDATSILDEIYFPAMTYRQVLYKMFEDNWNNQKIAKNMPDGNLFNGGLFLEMNNVPAEVVKQALKDFQEAGKG